MPKTNHLVGGKIYFASQVQISQTVIIVWAYARQNTMVWIMAKQRRFLVRGEPGSIKRMLTLTVPCLRNQVVGP